MIKHAKAHWLTADVIAYPAAGLVSLYYSANADIYMDEAAASLVGGIRFPLKATKAPHSVIQHFPHLASWPMWKLPAGIDHQMLLKGQLIVAAYQQDGRLLEATKVQTRGVLDQLYAEAARQVELGICVGEETSFALWAPTAQKAELLLFDLKKQLLQVIEMTECSDSGVWRGICDRDIAGLYYRFRVTLYHYFLDTVQSFVTTDPYSISLSTDSEYSQVVDINSPCLMPVGWQQDAVAAGQRGVNPEDISIYELHLRDFSVSDIKGSQRYHGKYLAFTEAERDSVCHLRALRAAGLTHIHLLPVFDIASINEHSDLRFDLDSSKAAFCQRFPESNIGHRPGPPEMTLREIMACLDPASGDAQCLMNDLGRVDSFNWGYDPFHYSVPEGSYATDPEGSVRILEFRQMIQALHHMGFCVVMDVVYNHTHGSGSDEKSVLDKIVPGYYHRLDPVSGSVERSTCCENTATEAVMFQKLMEDSLSVWARDYHIDGFRFDLMGHHPRTGMIKALQVVKQVCPHAYFYGEGWNFGEVVDDRLFTQATQLNMSGTGIGTFSDRMRDAVRGGSPFDTGKWIRANQGFANGLYYLPNEVSHADAESKQSLLISADLIRLGMAANLVDFILTTHTGANRQGKQISYNGQPAAYARLPTDTINYVSKHDNQTLWDNNQYKIATATSTAVRVRMQVLALALPLFSQGIPFLHMGCDLLRSKSMARDSYNAGDWFNKVDFSKQSTNWNVGLPSEHKDGINWPIIKQAIRDAAARPNPDQIEWAGQVCRDFIAIRYSSKLLRLATGEQIKARVDFPNTGPSQVAGVIVMTVDDGAGLEDLDLNHDAVVVMVNGTPEQQTLEVQGAENFQLHPRQAAGVDEVVKQAVCIEQQFTVPGLTAAVFVKYQSGVQGRGLAVKTKLVSSL